MPTPSRFRAVVVGLVALLATAPPVLAQPTTEQRRPFEAERLRVLVLEGRDAREVSIGSSASVRGARWIGYLGGERLSEAEFYDLAGRPDIAADARKRRTVGWALLGSGLIALGTGAYLAFEDGEASLSDRGDAIGIGLMLGGSWAMNVGRRRHHVPLTSPAFAVEMADEYNTAR